MLNDYGLKLKGIKKVAGESKYLKGFYGGLHIDVHYNLQTKELIWDYQVGNSWTIYGDPNIVKVATLWNRATMQHIADIAHEALMVRNDYPSFGQMA